MFTTLIVQPTFNLLVLIYALLPGHNFGLAIICFAIVVRLLLWPLLYRQLHQTKAMRKVQPELRRIKKETKGDRQKEAALTMALYKEYGVSPLASLGIAVVQIPILLALYAGIRRVLDNPHQLVSFAYSGLQQLPWMQELAHNIHRFDGTLFGVVDLTRGALEKGVYWPALVIVLASAAVQYFQARQLLVSDKSTRTIRQIMRAASAGEQADQAEVSAAMSRLTVYFIPALVLLFTLNLPSALGLYWLVGGLVALAQQSLILREDETQLEAIADKPSRDVAAIPEAEVVSEKSNAHSQKSKPKDRRHKRRRRK